ncbi:uncharacterized protein LOC119683574 [Teleopsis dalmanni]|uniref:uncharacterized protein LOC119683574 n=1 Tax=Teleopsis dalmanni TaxID=139649 RepID=UPI000D32A2F2|nr:uncharacterized protein LOC119683574 [Teleopsis dalmanni]
MSSRNLWSFNLTILFLIVGIVSVLAVSEPCPIRFKCSNEEKPVWALLDQDCQLYRNECHLKNANCQRQNRYEPVLVETTKEKCQEYCATICTADYRPVYAEYRGKVREFPNACALESHKCTTGEAYV